ncbi:N-acetylmuramic acid 6-phosphate etherase [bacterium]|nr:N-acetylmuramic acid 6-phosphate etherase [bacterium]
MAGNADGTSRSVMDIDRLTTEAVNEVSATIDTADALEIVRIMNAEDAATVAAVGAVSPEVARAIDIVAEAFRTGGRLIYMGAGTSGRLGVLDASECPPTFGSEPGMVVGLIAGGERALRHPVEGAEDSPEQGAADLKALALTSRDVVMGIATSGRTPYVLGGLSYAGEIGAATIGFACNQPSAMDNMVQVMIAPVVGPEVLSGSTRLKAGTATKLVLNMITTGAMIRIGKTYGNRMVDLKPLNEKLRIRSRRIIRDIAGVDDSTAAACLAATSGHLKPALTMALAGIDAGHAHRLLAANGGHVRSAVAAALEIQGEPN